MFTTSLVAPARRRLSRGATSIAAAALLLARTVPGPLAELGAPNAPDSGRGWATAVTCVGCIGGGVGIAMTGGLAAVLAASFIPGSTLVVAGCVYACYDAVSN